MSTPVGSSQWMYSTPSSFYPYLIDQSLRFNDDDSAYLSRTPASAGNRKTWTWSAWVKRSTLGTFQTLFSTNQSNNDATAFNFGFTSADKLVASPWNNDFVTTSAVFRDVSSWYHIVLEFDTTQSGSNNSDRLKIYVNGVSQTLVNGTATLALNDDEAINQTEEHRIGVWEGTSWYFDGYMAEVNFIDGTALDATSFGETINGVWVPKEYTGSHGSAGYYLPFDDSSAIGDDESGNTNDWTANNLAATDIVIDSPTNNFPVVIPGYNQTTQEGGLKLKRSSTGNNHTGCFSTMGVSSGKWYVEIKYEDSGIDTVTFGVAETEGGFDPSVDLTSYIETSGTSVNTHNEFATWLVDARLSSSYAGTLGSAGSYGSSPSSGDIIQIALDMDDKKIWYGVNGTYIASGDPANGTNASQSGSSFNPTGEVVFVASAYMGRDFSISFNFGQDSANVSSANTDENGIGTFEYAPPSGFLALCSSNLPEPTIGPNSTEQADDYFDTILYTAATSNGTHTHGNLSFRPDFSWIKNRNNAERHFLTDVVRGNTSVTDKFLVSSGTSAEGTNGTSGTTFSVTDTGYEFVEASISTGELYFNGRTYVGWNWKAGGTAVSNSDGSITSSVSAAPDAGFSICTYTGTATVSESFGHGLNQAPELVITKARNSTNDWRVHGSVLGTHKFLSLSGTGAVGTDSTNGGFPDNTDTLVNLGYESTNGTNYIAYCFHSVPGYQTVGSYVGNGSTDGVFVYTGFEVAFLLTKETSSTSGWNIRDNKRSPENVVNEALQTNTNGAELTSGYDVDFLSNGFKLRTSLSDSNTNGQTYIYLAIGSSFKYANAR